MGEAGGSAQGRGDLPAARACWRARAWRQTAWCRSSPGAVAGSRRCSPSEDGGGPRRSSAADAARRRRRGGGRRRALPAAPRRAACPRGPGASRRGRTGCPRRSATRWSTTACAPRGPTRCARPSWPTPGRTSWWRPAPRPASRWPTSCRCSPRSPPTPRATALYLSPTKALAADQLRALAELDLPDVRPAALRRRHPARRARLGPHGTPAGCSATRTCCTARCCPGTPAGRRSCAGCATSSSTSATPTAGCSARTSRCCCGGCCGSARGTAPHPTLVLASATVADPAAFASRLTGRTVVAVSEDGSPSAGRTLALWEPPLLPELTGENGAPVRRPAGTEAARMLADLVVEGARTLAFVRSRRGAEVAALSAQRLLADVDTELVEPGGRLPRRLPPRGAAGAGGGAGTAVTCSGWRRPTRSSWAWTSRASTPWWWPGFPGTRASFWQQAGRAGRARDEALVVLVARDDPLDTYLVHHPRRPARRARGGLRAQPRQPLRAGARSWRAPRPSCR